MSTQRHYLTDLTDAQWQVIAPLLPCPKQWEVGCGRPPCDQRFEGERDFVGGQHRLPVAEVAQRVWPLEYRF